MTCPITLLHRRYHRLSPTVFIFVFTLDAAYNWCFSIEGIVTVAVLASLCSHRLCLALIRLTPPFLTCLVSSLSYLPHHSSLLSLFYSASPKSVKPILVSLPTYPPTTTFGPRSSNSYLSPCLLSATCIPSFNMNARWGWSVHKRFAGLV